MNRMAYSRRGGALVMTAVSLTSLSVLSLSLLSVMMAGSTEQRIQREKLRAEYTCEAALQRAVVALNTGGTGALGSAQIPQVWGDARYWVTSAAPSANVRTLIATAEEDRAGASVELTLQRQLNALWRYGAFGEASMHMDSNARLDSYNSALGTWNSQAENNSGSMTYALSNGDIGSNGHVLMEQNSKVWGDATCGVNSTTTVMGNAVCSGSTSPAASPLALPPLALPFALGTTSINVTGSFTITAGNNAYADFVGRANSVTTIVGPATVVFRNFQLRSGAQLRCDTTAGPVKIFVQDNFVLNSNTSIHPLNQLPKDLEVNLLSNNIVNPAVVVALDTVDFDSNAKLYGTLYAPNAHVEIDSNFEVFGAIMAKSVDLDSNCSIHYDEDLALSKGGSWGDYTVVCWRALPYQH